MAIFRTIPKTIFRASAAVTLVSALALTACGSNRVNKAEIEIRDDSSGRTARTPVEFQVDGQNGSIRDYGYYQAVIARRGETIAAVARRIGISAEELADYNGLAVTQVLKSGDELVLPARSDRYRSLRAGDDSQTTTGGSVILAAPLDGQNAGDEAWSPDIAARAIARAGGSGDLSAPSSSTNTLPRDPQAPKPLGSPNLRQSGTAQQTQTEIASTRPYGAQFLRPVSGPIAIGYGQGAGGTRNDGIDFSAPAGTPVVAVEDGEVALVSESLGNLGTIVLLRHADGLLTVYGRITDVSVTKGTPVGRGQQIGLVAEPPRGESAMMHFEVRQGADSLDPTPFLGG